MAGLSGMLAAAILKVVGDQIGSAIGGQIKLQKNFHKELKKMKMALESVDALLPPCKIAMANRMEKMREDLEVITDQHRKFKLTEGTNDNDPKVTGIYETSSNLETPIIGRTADKDKILSYLLHDMTVAITILSIYGIGGLGKTTLAKMVYNSSEFKEYSQVWVYVSQTFDLKNIGNSIISQLSGKNEETKYNRMQMIQSSLEKHLADKKIVIVVDDLWESDEFHLESLKDMLMFGKASNLVVIITTRDERIAKKIATIQPYKLAPLTDDMCWSIIKQKSGFESSDDKEQLEKIGRAIAMKCGGVALAAKSLGLTLKSKDSVGEWKSVRDSNIWTLSSLNDTSSIQVLTSLKLSYSDMPSHLKLCFAYCAIFPKGHRIVKNDLIHQWISLGFSTWQLGERYISQLLGLSFLELLKPPSTIKFYDEDITFLTMHDLVHDLARSVMDDEILVVDKGNNAEGSCYHYALLNDCSKPLGLESTKIRALRFMDCDKIELDDAAFSSAKSLRVLDLRDCIIHKLTDCIGELKQLRYLNIPRVQDEAIPDSINKLSKLIYLNLHGSRNLFALPESIGEIEGLMFLDLSGCSRLEKLPESFGKLNELVHLDLSNCSRVGGISDFLEGFTQLQYLNLSYCPNIGELPEALGGLSKLKYLNLSFSSYLKCCKEAEFLCALTKLEYLNLSSECCDLQKLPDALGRFTQLKYLNLSGCHVLTVLPILSGSLKILVHLDLSYCERVLHLHDVLVGLTNLQYLNLKGTYGIAPPDSLTKLRYFNLSNMRYLLKFSFDCTINDISSNLPNLEHLDLSTNKIRSIPESLCNLRKLHTLDLSHCLLCSLPESIGTIDSLKFLHLNGCPIISEIPQLGSGAIFLPYFPVRSSNGESSSNLVRLQHIDPVKLKITKLENVKSVGEAHRIKLVEKKNLKELKLEWTGAAERFVDDKMLLQYLVPPSTLKKLEICGYNNNNFPSWLVSRVPNIDVLVLRGMENLIEWNTSYSSGEEHVIERLEIHDCPKLGMNTFPPKAKSWVITNSDNVLSSWEERIVSHNSAYSSCSITTKLSVQRCKVPMHQWRLLQQFSGLTCLSIQNCGNLTGSRQISQHLYFVKSLCLEDGELEEIPKWIGELVSLQDLQIRGCIGLTGWNENMRHLTKLKSLQLYRCNSMASLPYWLDELTSLKELFMEGCDILRSLPGSIQQLSSLQKLEISCCPELKDLVELEGGKMKLMHNQERVCVLPTSLKELKISGCGGIRSLPEGINQLTNLQKLNIVLCPKLSLVDESKEGKMRLTHHKERVCVLPTSLKTLKLIGIRSCPESLKELTNLQKITIRNLSSGGIRGQQDEAGSHKRYLSCHALLSY
ncbi:unnamed protein product [Alopecurus aequalis]